MLIWGDVQMVSCVCVCVTGRMCIVYVHHTCIHVCVKLFYAAGGLDAGAAPGESWSMSVQFSFDNNYLHCATCACIFLLLDIIIFYVNNIYLLLNYQSHSDSHCPFQGHHHCLQPSPDQSCHCCPSAGWCHREPWPTRHTRRQTLQRHLNFNRWSMRQLQLYRWCAHDIIRHRSTRDWVGVRMVGVATSRTCNAARL